ncbi:MAG: hypothetical protein KBS99_08350 [Prevotellaceae bacterium]|nr:hypothetical protein [Candidatus Colivivens caballi]
MKRKYKKPFIKTISLRTNECLMTGSIDVSTDLGNASLDDSEDIYADQAL